MRESERLDNQTQSEAGTDRESEVQQRRTMEGGNVDDFDSNSAKGGSSALEQTYLSSQN